MRPAGGQTCPPCGRTTPDGRRGSKAPSPTLPLCSRRAGARFNRSARDRVTGWSKCDVVRAWQGLPCASGAPISRVSTAARRTSRPTAGRSGTALGKRTKHGSPCHVRTTMKGGKPSGWHDGKRELGGLPLCGDAQRQCFNARGQRIDARGGFGDLVAERAGLRARGGERDLVPHVA